MKNKMNDYTQKCNHPEIRELTLANGIAYPSDEELVMLILGKGTKDNPIEQLSEKVIQAINASNEDNLVENLTAIDGMGSSRALAISAAIELGRRRKGFLHSIIRKPKDVVPYIKHYSLMKSEHFITITTNGAHEIIGSKVISIGTVSRALIHPREVFADAVSQHASGIICCHNHPCNQCYPSNADIESTKQLYKASSILGISFLDHIIITRDGYFSFLEHGMLENDRSFDSL
ncbi:MAG: DNA repair protein RadC [Spirochaetia bacterium]|uniref:JAB domain-containing protein n=1 Tax=Treponema sp. TaxID=166 RepID=UPI00298DAEBF|nr:DNA repair protein RadC [Treponema sp.]MCI7397664.1 DNA repair protein RadC [Spirochaetia bacterium]MCI7577115.1 DNA repair protein RadC [Spirochaetia bacterium]